MAKRFRVIFLLAVAAFVGVDMLEPPPVSAVRGWHYKHKKPPGKRPRPKKKRGLYVQTDPLRILKNFNDDSIKVGPNIIIAMDTSMRMQYDSDGHFYDERYWDATAKYDNKTETPPRTVATTLGVPAASRYYRRKLKNLVRTEVNATTDTFAAELITATPDSSADYLTFYDTSRLGMARDGLYQAIDENMYVVNFGLLETRHKDNVQIPEDPGNQYPVVLSDPSQANLIGDIKDQKQWKTTYMVPTARNVDQAYSEANVLHVKVIEQSDASSKTAYWMMHPVDDDQQDQTLVPAGRDTATFHDSPVKTLIDDALTAVKKGMEKDKDQLRPCRNTAVILVVGGKEGGSADPVATSRSRSSAGATSSTRISRASSRRRPRSSGPST
ncbi:MAG: hypothetical protein NTY02_10210 [Acidobacteria bacterium]|nr:hypothetical protein [Acidobacteriota bacterium]